jgi:hypothetical protein
MSSIEEVWGAPFPKKHHTMASKYATKEEVRDPEKEGRIHPTPIHRTNAAVTKHRKTIDDLTKTLPLSNSDEESQSNFAPARVPQLEHMSNYSSTKSGYTKPFFPSDPGLDFAYAPTRFQEDAHEMKLNRILHMIEQNKTGFEQPSSQDMMLYIFTGVFFLFTLDTFVSLGRRMR